MQWKSRTSALQAEGLESETVDEKVQTVHKFFMRAQMCLRDTLCTIPTSVSNALAYL